MVAGDVGHSPEALLQLAGWPVPVLYVPGNHEYDGSDVDDADEELREVAHDAGVTLLNLDEHRVGDVRFLGCSRWWDFDLLGPHRREECMRAAERYLRHMGRRCGAGRSPPTACASWRSCTAPGSRRSWPSPSTGARS